jgi:hypothetical protein
MRNTHNAWRVVGPGLALMFFFALVGGCTAMDPAAPVGESDNEAIADAEERLSAGVYRCSMAGTKSSLIAKEDGSCIRYATPLVGASTQFCHDASCSSCARVGQMVGCRSVRAARLRHYVQDVPRTFRCTLADGAIVGALEARPDATCSRINTPVHDASTEFCLDGVCPSCWSLGRDMDCILTD